MDPAFRPWIRAHEIGEYVFCARAWWHRRQGHPSTREEDAERGRRFHMRAGQQRRWGDRLVAMAVLLLIVGLLLLFGAFAFR